MTNRNKIKGDRFEREIAAFLEPSGAYRTVNAGVPHDVGDIHLPGITIQAKNHGRLALAEWVDQAVAQAARSDRLPVVVHKRRQKGVAEAYATMPLWAFRELINRGS